MKAPRESVSHLTLDDKAVKNSNHFPTDVKGHKGFCVERQAETEVKCVGGKGTGERFPPHMASTARSRGQQ